jgi:hypothetical protein
MSGFEELKADERGGVDMGTSSRSRRSALKSHGNEGDYSITGLQNRRKDWQEGHPLRHFLLQSCNLIFHSGTR